jgi:TPR repeat protein
VTAHLTQHAFAWYRSVTRPNFIATLRPVCSSALLIAGVLSLYAPHVFADIKSAEQAMQQQRFADALAELQPLAKAGNAQAQVDLGTLLMLGQGLPRDDAAALALFNQAAKAGDPLGDLGLASFYVLRQPGPQSYARALEGNAMAQAGLGGLYLTGCGTGFRAGLYGHRPALRRGSRREGRRCASL